MAKSSNKELKFLQSLPLDQKVEKTILRVREWYDYYKGYVYLSFSGGKDSTVLRHIITERMHLNIPIVFCDTGLEYPEVRNFALENCNTLLRPSMDFRSVILKYGYPCVSKEVSQKIYYLRNYTLSDSYKDTLLNGTNNRRSKLPDKWKYLLDAPFQISHKCCDVLKKSPFKRYARNRELHGIVATMAEESFLRQSDFIRHDCNSFDSELGTSKPMSFWTEQDVLEYISRNSVAYAPVYGEIINGCDGKYCTTGVNRTGCIFCMFGAHLDPLPNRFQQLRNSHPQLYAYCMKPLDEGGLGLATVLNYLNIPYE